MDRPMQNFDPGSSTTSTLYTGYFRKKTGDVVYNSGRDGKSIFFNFAFLKV